MKPLNPRFSTNLKGSSSIIIILQSSHLHYSWLNSTSFIVTGSSPLCFFKAIPLFFSLINLPMRVLRTSSQMFNEVCGAMTSTMASIGLFTIVTSSPITLFNKIILSIRKGSSRFSFTFLL